MAWGARPQNTKKVPGALGFADLGPSSSKRFL
jgi:hypothetical protein